MKNLITIIVLIFIVTINTFAQIENVEEVVTVEGIDKDNLFNRADNFFVTAYKSANAVIQSKDISTGKIIGKGVIVIPAMWGEYQVDHTVSIYVKDGRYKYTISVSRVKIVYGKGIKTFSPNDYPKSWAGKKKFYAKMDVKLIALQASIKNTLNVEAETEEDW